MLERLVERDPGFYHSKERERRTQENEMDESCRGIRSEERENVVHA